MEKVEVRMIQNEDELKQANLLWEEVFPEDHGFFQDLLALDEHYHFNTTWIAKVNGNMAASVQIFPYYFRYLDTIFKVGGIGNVATLPEYRGRGLALTILRRQIDWMMKNDFDLSHLSTGIHAFYKPLGWHTMPHETYVLENMPQLANNNYEVTEFTKADLQQVQSLYDDFSDHSVGMYIRSTNYWKKQLKRKYNNPAHFLVAQQGETIVAYLRFDVHDEQVVIAESCYEQAHQKALLDLLQQIKDRHENVEKFTITFGSDHYLKHFFKEAGAEKVMTTHTMWKIVNQQKVMQKLKQMMLENIAKENIDILLQCELTDYLLSKKGQTLDIKQPTEPFTYDQFIKCGEDELLSMLFKGSRSDPTDEINPCHKLLPEKVAYYFWSTDSF